MKQQLTTETISSLKNEIYNLLMQNPKMDMGDMNNCSDAAEFLVDNWMQENNIEEILTA